MMSKATSESIESLLLTPKENKLVVHILGKGKKSLATAVAQVFLALPSDRTQWSKIGTGVVCFVKDKAEKSFFIRMLDIKEKCIVWEQEIYKQFKYRAVSKHFQTFFADDCRAGINFSSAEEAAIFRAAVMERVNVLKKKREEVRQRKMATYQQKQQMNYQMAMQNPYFRMPMVPAQMQSLLFMQMRSPAVAASQRAQLQAMFNSMTPETRQAFFTSLNGGPSVMVQPGNFPGMQWPGGNQSISSLPVSSSSQVVAATMPQPPLLDQPLTSESAIVETTPRNDSPDVPPEPPVAPAPGAPSPPPPPPPPPPTCTPPPPLLGSTSSVTKSSAGPPPTSDRSGLLESIQAGTKLRKVDESSSRKKIPMVESGMRGALARALDNRAKVLGDEDSDDDVDEEWDDDDEDDWSD